MDDKNQAIPNSHLKSRIDQFILKHSELLKHLPRTLGNSKGQGLLSSRLVQSNNISELKHIESSSKYETAGVKCQYNSAKSNKSSKLENDLIQRELKRKHSDFDDNTPSCSSERTSSMQLTGPPNKRVHHENSLQQSLDSALDKMLENLPTFRKSLLANEQTRDNDSAEVLVHQKIGVSKTAIESVDSFLQAENSSSAVNNKAQGSLYKSCDTSDEILQTEGIIKCVNCGEDDTLAWYRIPCGHLYCRNCVRSSTIHTESMECNQCHNICSKSDIVKVYKS